MITEIPKCSIVKNVSPYILIYCTIFTIQYNLYVCPAVNGYLVSKFGEGLAATPV